MADAKDDTKKAPTHGERIDALEDALAASNARFDKLELALASGDPTMIAAQFAK